MAIQVQGNTVIDDSKNLTVTSAVIGSTVTISNDGIDNVGVATITTVSSDSYAGNFELDTYLFT